MLNGVHVPHSDNVTHSDKTGNLFVASKGMDRLSTGQNSKTGEKLF